MYSCSLKFFEMVRNKEGFWAIFEALDLFINKKLTCGDWINGL